MACARSTSAVCQAGEHPQRCLHRVHNCIEGQEQRAQRVGWQAPRLRRAAAASSSAHTQTRSHASVTSNPSNVTLRDDPQQARTQEGVRASAYLVVDFRPEQDKEGVGGEKEEPWKVQQHVLHRLRLNVLHLCVGGAPYALVRHSPDWNTGPLASPAHRSGASGNSAKESIHVTSGTAGLEDAAQPSLTRRDLGVIAPCPAAQRRCSEAGTRRRSAGGRPSAWSTHTLARVAGFSGAGPVPPA